MLSWLGWSVRDHPSLFRLSVPFNSNVIGLVPEEFVGAQRTFIKADIWGEKLDAWSVESLLVNRIHNVGDDLLVVWCS